MSRRTNVINNILSMLITVAAVFLVAQICNVRYTGVNFFGVICLLVLGAVVAGFFCTVAHEVGHLIAGRKNGFKFSALSVWFFRWRKTGKKTAFDFVLPGESAGYTEMIPDGTENLARRVEQTLFARAAYSCDESSAKYESTSRAFARPVVTTFAPATENGVSSDGKVLFLGSSAQKNKAFYEHSFVETLS